MLGLTDTSLLLMQAVAGAGPWWDVLIQVGLFVVTMLVVVSVFGQSGEIRLSAQREAALATGHTDRRTVFEKPLLRPIMWMLLNLSHRLALPGLKAWIGRTLIAAGSPDFYTPQEYLSLSMLSGFALATALELLHLFVYNSLSVVAIVAGLVLGMGMSLFQLYSKATQRLKDMSKRIPYTLDLIALAMGAGATFTEALQTVVTEQSDDPFNVELRAVLAEMDLGSTRRQALTNLADRIPMDMLRSIVASIVQAEELGTPLTGVLHSEATLMRMQRSVRAENAAAVASVRMLLPGLLILMSVILAIFGPTIINISKGGLF